MYSSVFQTRLRHGIAAVRVIDFEHGIQSAEEVFRAVQRIDVDLGRILMEHFIGIEHDCGHTETAGGWQMM